MHRGKTPQSFLAGCLRAAEGQSERNKSYPSRNRDAMPPSSLLSGLPSTLFASFTHVCIDARARMYIQAHMRIYIYI